MIPDTKDPKEQWKDLREWVYANHRTLAALISKSSLHKGREEYISQCIRESTICYSTTNLIVLQIWKDFYDLNLPKSLD